MIYVYKSIKGTDVTLDNLVGKITEAGGVATSAELKAMGFSPGLISYAYEKGLIDKLTRGVYCTLDVFEDDFATVCARWKKCIISHACALYLNGLSDRLPTNIDVTVPHGYNPSSLSRDFPNVVVHRIAPELHALGLAKVKTPAGNYANCYDAERSIADLIKERRRTGADAQLVRDAIGGYFRRQDKDLPKLVLMCEALGVHDELQVYLEVL